jgi:hypothetical protein
MKLIKIINDKKIKEIVLESWKRLADTYSIKLFSGGLSWVWRARDLVVYEYFYSVPVSFND